MHDLIDRLGAVTECAGHLRKMRIEPGTEDGEAQYWLRLDEQELALNPYLGQPLALEYAGVIHCSACGRRSRKSYGQGYCYPCFKTLPQCDRCIMSPEHCHYHRGTCRDAAWGEQFCMSPHIVYLANASGLKVGITRRSQMPTRWLDQGAIAALPLFAVPTRRLAGQIEDLLRQSVSDRTNWRAMLKGAIAEIDLEAARTQLWQQYAAAIAQRCIDVGCEPVEPLFDETPRRFRYPVLSYPGKVSSHNLEKTPVVSGRLMGLKGQYLILDSGVINLRKYSSYRIEARLGAA